MISASGSNPLERYSKCTLILQVIQLMNDPGPEALADPTLIMLREPHLGGTGGRLANSGTETQETACGPRAARSSPWRHCNALGKVSLSQKLCGVIAGTNSQSTCYGRANGCHQFKTVSTDRPLEESVFFPFLTARELTISRRCFKTMMPPTGRFQHSVIVPHCLVGALKCLQKNAQKAKCCIILTSTA